MELKVDICESKCNQCLFSKNKIVSNERRKEILDDCKQRDDFFLCHKGTIAGKKVMCKGFFDSKYKTTLQSQAESLGMLNYIKPETIK